MPADARSADADADAGRRRAGADLTGPSDAQFGESGVGERVAWFDPHSGIAGDMALGALLDAGASVTYVRGILDLLGLDGWSLETERTVRDNLAATRASVRTAEIRHHRRWRDISALLASAPLPSRVADRAAAVFAALAHAEAAVHDMAPDDVHFHEVGALDAIVDVVGVCAALESLDVDAVECGPVRVGSGTISAAHGLLPNPPPAVVRLLLGKPVVGVDLDAELTTPTGAALMSALARRFGPPPSMTPIAAGYGAGTRQLPGRPNVTGVVIGETAPSSPVPTAADTPPATPAVVSSSAAPPSLTLALEAIEGVAQVTPLVELVANLDDVTGETLGHAVDELVSLGALDVWVTPAIMKKNRPAHLLCVLCKPADATPLAAAMARLTGTLGLRARTVARAAFERSSVEMRISGQIVRVKTGPHGAKPEWDDVRAAAAALGIPARRLSADVMAAYFAQTK